MSRFLSLALLLSLPNLGAADSLVYVRAHRPLIEERLKLAPLTPAERLHVLRAMFEKAGCPQIAEQDVPKEDYPNLICSLPGTEPGTIVVAAALDYPEKAASDDSYWGGLAMLPLLAESLAPVPHRYRLTLVAFSGHEHGLRGSSWYVKLLTEEQRAGIRAVVDLDGPGKTPPVYALPQGDRSLATWFEVAAKTLQLPNVPAQVTAEMVNSPVVDIGPLATRDEDLYGDALSFQHAHLPTITVQSAPARTLPELRRTGAVPQSIAGNALDLDTYEDTYRLMCVYVLYLDSNLGRVMPRLGVFAGKLVDMSGLYRSDPRDLRLTVKGYNTSGELNRYELLLKQGGQHALADALAEAPDKGQLQIALDLAVRVELVSLKNTPQGQHIFAVAARASRHATTAVRDYRFAVVELDIDKQGKGEGRYTSSAKLRFNKNHELEVEDYETEPGHLSNVLLERPAEPPKAPPATLVASNTAPSQTPSEAAGATVTAPQAAVPSPASGAGVASAAASPSGVSPSAAAGPAADQKADLTTFTAKAQLVQVDVTVTDSRGAPIEGLKASDFSVTENGKPQTVRVFEAHSGKTPAPAGPPPNLPANTYSNRVAARGEESLNVLLFDLLNTPTQDQAYARKEMLKVLKNLPRGRQVSVFVLTSKLDLVQGFTDNSGTLEASVDKILRDRSNLLTTEAERQSTQGFTEEIGRFAQPALPAQAPASAASGGDMDIGSSRARQQTEGQLQSNRMALRLGLTLEALAGISRAVAGYPGRKNMVWLAGGFPVRLRPNTGLIANPNQSIAAAQQLSFMSDNPDFQAVIRSTTALLAAARVAVYPVDVRGLQVSGVDITVGAAESASFTGTDNPTAYTSNLNSQAETRYQDRSGMMDVAQQTGGEVFAGNDIGKVIMRSMDDGSTYYTVAYTPETSESDEAFRRIDVKLGRKDAKLSYRRGYYPVTKKAGLTPLKVHPLVSAMQPGMPQSTLLMLTAQVLPPADANGPVKVAYTIDTAGIEFDDAANQRKHAVLDYMAVAFDSKGEPVGQASNTADTSLPPADYAAVQKTGLILQQELKVPAGSYILKIGIMDRATQKTGTLEVPLVVGKQVAQK